MATITPTTEPVPVVAPDQCLVVSWLNVAEGDDALVYEFVGKGDRSVQMDGAFGGGAMSLLGSIDGVKFVTMLDYDGMAITLSNDTKIVGIRENVRYLKPGNGDGTSMSVSVYIYGSG